MAATTTVGAAVPPLPDPEGLAIELLQATVTHVAELERLATRARHGFPNLSDELDRIAADSAVQVLDAIRRWPS